MRRKPRHSITQPATVGAQPERAARVAPAISPDGYIRLSLAHFRAFALRHLLSGLHDDSSETADVAGASVALIVGFTEWVSDTTPALSFGWNWRLETSGSDARYIRDGEVRSNVMLCEPGIGDLGDAATSATLTAAIDALSWRTETHHYLTKRYR